MSALCASGDFPQRRMSLMEEEMEDIDVLKPIHTQCNNEEQHSPLVILTPALTALNEDKNTGTHNNPEILENVSMSNRGVGWTVNPWGLSPDCTTKIKEYV